MDLTCGISKKKDGTMRFCVDYRKINAITINDSYPLPRIDDILDQLAGNIWFTTLDLKSGYWQIKVGPEDREKTAFSVGNGTVYDNLELCLLVYVMLLQHLKE